jgi:hypothetical protein
MDFRLVIYCIVVYFLHELFSRSVITLCAHSIKYVIIGPKGIK